MREFRYNEEKARKSNFQMVVYLSIFGFVMGIMGGFMVNIFSENLVHVVLGGIIGSVLFNVPVFLNHYKTKIQLTSQELLYFENDKLKKTYSFEEYNFLLGVNISPTDNQELMSAFLLPVLKIKGKKSNNISWSMFDVDVFVDLKFLVKKISAGFNLEEASSQLREIRGHNEKISNENIEHIKMV